MRHIWSVEDQVDEFVDEINAHGKDLRSYNRWIKDESLNVYVRRSYRSVGHGELRRMVYMFDIASVTATPQGTGRFTRFLEFVERHTPFDGVLIENVQEPRFAEFFRKRDHYREVDTDGIFPSFYRLWDGLA